jgi:hypothetical protein
MRVLLADAVLVVHFLFVLFVVGGLLLTWIGAWRGWRWIRSLSFRIAHLAAIVFVACEALLGIACPLTEWEDALRNTNTIAGDKSFVARWVHQLMFFAAPEWVFTVLYVVFALVVAATLWFIPPRRKSRAK